MFHIVIKYTYNYSERLNFMKRIIAMLLSVIMAVTVVCVPAFAADNDTAAEPAVSAVSLDSAADALHLDDVIKPLSKISFSSLDSFAASMVKVLYGVVDLLIDNIVGAINNVIPSYDFIDKADYSAENFYEGTKDFLTSAAPGARWSLGYSSASLQTGDELDGKHYVGGSLSLDKSATAIYDDQRVRVVCLNDGSGRGTVAFATLDAFGLSLPDVREIRSRLTSFAKNNNIVSINITVLHQHSCVDTLGMNGNLIKMLFANTAVNVANKLAGIDAPIINGQNKAFMENLFNVTARAIREAYNNMETGEIYYSEIDAADYIRDKREPMVYDTDIHRFRFVPDDGGRETWLCNAAIHCVGNGAAGREITGDYPYYMEQVINNEGGANFMLIQGAELAISNDNTPIDEEAGDAPRIEKLQYYGRALGRLVVNSTAPETLVEPLLNIRFVEYTVPVTNQILVFAAKLGAVTNLAVSNNKRDTDLEVVTEIGYMELGNDLAVAIIPGELEPSIAYGGALGEDNSYRNEAWEYPSMQEIVGERELLVFGIANDQIGYILTDNDYSSIVSGVNEEIVATGDKAGSTTITAFEQLIASVR